LDPWWQVSKWPVAGSNSGVLLGQRAAQFVGNEKTLSLSYAGNTMKLNSVEQLKTGGDEDSRIYLGEAAFRALTMTDVPKEGGTKGHWVKPSVIELQIPGGEVRVNQAIAQLQKAFPQATVAPVRQLVEGESSIVDKTHALMFGAVLLIALTVAVSVLATLSASVLERRRDFALMKALGGSDAQMMGLFVLETVLLAAGGIVLGYIVGSAAAWAISEANFGTSALPRMQVIPLIVLLNLAIAALAALVPVQQLRGLEPAALLKGE
jgi:putative ABC transport system permease protein